MSLMGVNEPYFEDDEDFQLHNRCWYHLQISRSLALRMKEANHLCKSRKEGDQGQNPVERHR